MVSPLYVAVHKHQNKSIDMLLKEDYSPDAQDCTHILGLRSPISFALSLTSSKPYRFVRKQIWPLQELAQNKTDGFVPDFDSNLSQ